MSSKTDHDRLRQLMSDFARLLAGSYAESRPAMLSARFEFARVFAAHVAAERAHLHSLRQTRPHDAASIIAGYETRMAKLQTDYSAHINTWTPTRIGEDWVAYALAVKSLQNRLRAQMLWEEEHIPLAA